MFKKLLYAYVALRCVLWLVDYDLLFGDYSIVVHKNYQLGVFKQLAFLLYNTYPGMCYPALIVLLALSFLSFFRQRIYFVTDGLIWFLMLNLNNAAYPTLTGGDFLLNQLLLFNVFLSEDFENKNPVTDQLRICVHNFAVLAIFMQICFLYLVSGLTKVLDAAWANGTAISEISQVKHYNLFHPITFEAGSVIGMLLNYLVLFYQLLFPFIVWFKNIKKIVLICGVAIHLYIAFVMGLSSFGIVMLIPYVFFWPRQETR